MYGSHAIVLGSGIAGLLTARTLTDHFSRVTLIERDALPRTHGPRKGVPQGNHTHSLMTSGQRLLDRLFPGLRSELIERGAMHGDVGQRPFFVAGVRFAPAPSEMRLLGASRALIEGAIRDRLLALPQIDILDDCDVLGLSGTAAAVRGVRIRLRRQNIARELGAELVVDATGRGSKTPRWLEELGLAAPFEQRVRIDVGYTSCTYRRQPHHLGGLPGTVVGAAAPNPRAGIVLGIEDARWSVSLMGYLGDYPPTDHDGLVEFARGLPVPAIYEFLRTATPLSQPIRGRFPYSQRRHYERLSAFPEGLLVIGDALCSFNPIYAQGMSAAALQVEQLDRCLLNGDFRSCWRQFFTAAAKIIDTPWRLAVGGDLRFEAVPGPRPLIARVTNAYLKQLIRAAGTDPELGLAFQRVAHLLEPPASLFAPRLMGRVLAQRLNAAPRASLAQAPDPARVAVVERVSQVGEG